MLNVKQIKKLSDVELATLYSRLEKVLFEKENIFYKKFEDIHWNLKQEINRRNRILIFQWAVWCLKLNPHENQIKKAWQYADAVLNDCNYFETDSTHEIRGFDTKRGNPVLVDLVCHWSKI